MSASSIIESSLDLKKDGPRAIAARNKHCTALDVSIIIISFNTRDLLRECLDAVEKESAALCSEIFVVDNASSDGSAEMVEHEFPSVRLFRNDANLGFGRANNLALAHARGRYFVLLNSDAFLAPCALQRAIDHMDANPNCALGGGLLVGRDGAWQPSARSFHSVTGDAIVLTGLAAKFPRSRIFGRFDRTWADASIASPVDWVPGAFSILRPAALRHTGLFDPNFFLYYEEVDLCLRFKRAGYTVWYWPDVVITHVGGESSRQLTSLDFSSTAAQVVLWRMRSTLLYYRKHHGIRARFAFWMERTLYAAAVWRNSFTRDPERVQRKQHFRAQRALLLQAWKDTDGGRISPPRPW
jgi:GT2 family glycosyltransferase